MDTPDLIFLEPVFHNNLWGGRRLEGDFGYDIPAGPVGECWAISAHPAGDCRVASGAYAGVHLSELWRDHRELFGGLAGDRFPILVKIIDAADDLSVQVHPDDAYAAAHEGGSLGKRECWYVLDAEPGADIIVGQRAQGRDELAALVAEGRWDELLNRIPVRAGDFFRVEPGTVHAIRGGTMVLETQQASDVTYRLWDYDRRQADGTLRELHLEKALDVIACDQALPASGEVTAPEVAGVTHLMDAPDFAVDRVRVRPDAPVTLSQPWPFLCVSVVAGTDGTVTAAGAGGVGGGAAAAGGGAGAAAAGGGAGGAYVLSKGAHFVAPAGCGDLELFGDLELIVSHVPVPGCP